jgi:hypothetical protein
VVDSINSVALKLERRPKGVAAVETSKSAQIRGAAGDFTPNPVPVIVIVLAAVLEARPSNAPEMVVGAGVAWATKGRKART